MTTTDALVTYLNDHLAGSRSALQLLDGLIESSREGRTRQFFDSLRAEIAADRDVLENLIHRVGGSPSAVRDVGGWFAEKFARLKLAIDDPSDGPLRRLEMLEILALGIEGKRSLWRALMTIAPRVPELAGVNFGDLDRRAASQHARVEAQRIAATRTALTGVATAQSVEKRRDVSPMKWVAMGTAALMAYALVSSRRDIVRYYRMVTM